MRVADTSFLYALFSKSDAFHGRAMQAAAVPDAIVVPGEIFAETVALIHYRVGFTAARDAGRWLRTQASIRIASASKPTLDRAWGLFREARGRLSYPDAVVLAWCRERRVSALAFDDAILRRAKG